MMTMNMKRRGGSNGSSSSLESSGCSERRPSHNSDEDELDAPLKLSPPSSSKNSSLPEVPLKQHQNSCPFKTMGASERTAATTLMSTATDSIMTMSELLENDAIEHGQQAQGGGQSSAEASAESYAVPLPPHPQTNPSDNLRHDEQQCEAHYDLRDAADDDLEKGKLQFPDGLFGREDEISRLQALLETCCSGKAGGKEDSSIRIALLEGPSGVGKSGLVRQGLLGTKRKKSGYIATGKFNQQVAHPFSAILSSLDELVTTILQREEAAAAQQNQIPKSPVKTSPNGKVGAPPRLRIQRLSPLTRRLEKDHFLESQDADILSHFCPSFKTLWMNLQKETSNHGADGSTSTCTVSRKSSKMYHQQADIPQIAAALTRFFSLLTTPQQPLVWFLDDLQWADACSVELLQRILLSTNDNTSTLPSYPLDPVFFVGAFRPLANITKTKETASNDGSSDFQQQQNPCQDLLEVIRNESNTNDESDTNDRLLDLQVSNLRPKDILAFVCATLDDMSEEEAWPLTNALYSATLGNIFHCRQALEYLVRTNCLYYDVMFFSWQYKLTEGENGGNPDDATPLLEDAVSQDILQLVQSKMMACSESLQALLIRAALAANTVFSAPLLRDLLHATGYPDMTQNEFRILLNHAMDEGFLLDTTFSLEDEDVSSMDVQYFRFSHDKVKEAARELASLLPQTDREQLCLSIGTVLVEWAIQLASPASSGTTNAVGSKDWMWFVAMQHFNSLPLETLLDGDNCTETSRSSSRCLSRKISRTQLAEWNFRVSDLSLRKGSFQQSIDFLHSALRYLPEDEMWTSKQYYALSLRLYNKLMEIEFAQGNHDATKDAIAVILAKATSPHDQITAHYIRIQLSVESNDRAAEFGVAECLSVLKLYGLQLPLHPSSTEIFREKTQFTLAMKSRSVEALGRLKLVDRSQGGQGDIMRLLSQLSVLCSLAKNHTLNELVAFRAMRLTLEHGLSMYLALILTNYSVPLRIKGKLADAGKYSSLVKHIFERFAGTHSSSPKKNSEFLHAKLILYAGILPLREHSYSESLETFVDISHQALSQGETEIALMSAMNFPLTYFASGITINSLLEPKLTLFETKAKQLQRPGYVAIFYCARQVLLSLQGKNGKRPTEMRKEESVLSKLEEKQRGMTLRDFAIYRLFLACIYLDYDCMAEMMERLESWPLFDLPLARQYLRLVFGGIASFLLARKTGAKKYTKTGREMVKCLKQLNIRGNVNVAPVMTCLTAVERNKPNDYAKAIAGFQGNQMLHLQALMNELCGLWFVEHEPLLLGQDCPADSEQRLWMEGYLGQAQWLYQDWGAYGKVAALTERFAFLSQISRRVASCQASISSREKSHERSGRTFRISSLVDNYSVRSSRSSDGGSVTKRRPVRRRGSNGSSVSQVSSSDIDRLSVSEK